MHQLLGVRQPWLSALRRHGGYRPLLMLVPCLVIACGGGGAETPDGSGGTIGAAGSAAGVSGRTPDAGASGADEMPGGDAGDAGSGGLGGNTSSGGNAGSGAGAQNGGSAGMLGAPDDALSCAGGALSCGPNGDSCCATLAVPGGQFLRSYDGVSTGYQNMNAPASVTGFRLDKYEVTVGRFRRFVAAVVGSWRPPAGSGTRADLNLGMGHVNVGPAGGYEPGWDSGWNANLGAAATDWNASLACSMSSSTWTANAGKNEALPITCVDWYEALAFCIWDGASLPTEAEWNDAASGGDLQRVFPWSEPPNPLLIDCAHANYLGAANKGFCVSPATGAVNAVGSESPAGDGLWGQADLAGNVFEWVLDSYADVYSPSCPDCVYVDSAADRVIRGGGYNNDSSFLLSSKRTSDHPDGRAGNAGLRCARAL